MLYASTASPTHSHGDTPCVVCTYLCQGTCVSRSKKIVRSLVGSLLTLGTRKNVIFGQCGGTTDWVGGFRIRCISLNDVVMVVMR